MAQSERECPFKTERLKMAKIHVRMANAEKTYEKTHLDLQCGSIVHCYVRRSVSFSSHYLCCRPTLQRFTFSKLPQRPGQSLFHLRGGGRRSKRFEKCSGNCLKYTTLDKEMWLISQKSGKTLEIGSFWYYLQGFIHHRVFAGFLPTTDFPLVPKRELNVRCVLHDTLNQHIFHHYKLPTNMCSGLILGSMWKQLVLDRWHVFQPFTDKNPRRFHIKIKHNMFIKVWEMFPCCWMFLRHSPTYSMGSAWEKRTLTYQLSHEKNKLLLSINYTGWLIEILIMVYDNPNIIGQFFIPYEHIP